MGELWITGWCVFGGAGRVFGKLGRSRSGDADRWPVAPVLYNLSGLAVMFSLQVAGTGYGIIRS
jgi:hypothetical protein